MRKEMQIIGVIVTCLAVIGGGQQDIKFAPTKAALEKRDAELKRARSQYNKAATAAEFQLLKDLDAAAEKAMTAKNLDAANEAANLKKETAARLAEMKDGDTSDLPATGTDGHWLVHWPGATNNVTIANGIATSELTGTDHAKATLENGSIVLRWPKGSIDRFTGSGSGVYLWENWQSEDAGRFPKGLPSIYGRADTVK